MSRWRRRCSVLGVAAALCGCVEQRGGDGETGLESSTDESTGETNDDLGDETGDDSPACMHTGELVGGQTIDWLLGPLNPDVHATCVVESVGIDRFILACPDEPPYESGYVLDVDLPLWPGQQIRFDAISGPAWAWSMRDSTGRALMFWYESDRLPGDPFKNGDTFEPEFFAPLSVHPPAEPCPRSCTEDHGFLPAVCDCYRPLRAAFDVGGEPVVLLGGEAATLDGEVDGRVLLQVAWRYEVCEVEEYGIVEFWFVADTTRAP